MSFRCTKWPRGKQYRVSSHLLPQYVCVCFVFPRSGGVSVVSPGRPRCSPLPSAADPVSLCELVDCVQLEILLPRPETLLLTAELEQPIALVGQESPRWLWQGPGIRFSGIFWWCLGYNITTLNKQIIQSLCVIPVWNMHLLLHCFRASSWS